MVLSPKTAHETLPDELYLARKKGEYPPNESALFNVSLPSTSIGPEKLPPTITLPKASVVITGLFIPYALVPIPVDHSTVPDGLYLIRKKFSIVEAVSVFKMVSLPMTSTAG